MNNSPDNKFKSLPKFIKKPFTPKLVAPKRPSKPPSKFKSLKKYLKSAFTPKLVAPKKPSQPPKKQPTKKVTSPKLTAPKKPSQPPKKQPTKKVVSPKLTAPKKPSQSPTKQPTPKLTAPKKPSKFPKETFSHSKNEPPTKQPTKKVTSPVKVASKKVTSPVKVASKKVSLKTKSPIKAKSPKKVASPSKQNQVQWPTLDTEDIKLLQKYSIMNPRDVWGKNISRMTDATYVEKHAPKFKTVLDILQKEILPSTRKPLVGKALIYIKNKKDGLEALTTYLTSVGNMTPVRGKEKTTHVKPGDNLLIMGEFGEKSPFYSYGATTLQASKGIVSKFNEPDNALGTKYPVMIVHDKYMEGLDLTGVTHIILVQEPATPGTFDQIIGRGVRNCSHIKYPSSLWKVQIISLVNTYKKPTPDQVLEHNRERVTRLVDKVLKTTQENSLDCTVSQKRYGHKCIN